MLNRDLVTRWLKRGLLAAGLLLIAFWGVGLYTAGMGLMRGAQEAQDLLAATPSSMDPEAVGSLIRDARRNTVALKWRVGWLAPLGPRLTWVPRAGPLLGEAPALLDLGDALTALGVLLWDDVEPAAIAYQQGHDLLSLLPGLVTNVARESSAKLALAERAETAHAGLDVTALPYRFQDPIEKLGKVLPILRTGLAVADRMPILLGLDRPRTYLILALNESELRPSGGFISSVAEVQVANADVAAMTFRDSYAADDFTEPYPDPPDPLRQMMGVDLWVFRDSNWSPDFPTAARQAIALYRPGYPVEIDGVIGLDQEAVTQLVGALGTLDIPGEAEAVTGDTVLAYMHAAWAPEDGVLNLDWWRQRKDFMGELAKIAVEKVKSGNADYLLLAETMLVLLEERHLQIYTADDAAARVLAAEGWDGGLPLPSGTGDFLAVVEANVGYNKASAQVSRRLKYDVDLRGPAPVGIVELHYKNHNQASVPCNPAIRYDLRYEDMMDRCYWAHVRLYVPQNSRLDQASRHPIPLELLVSKQPWPGEALTETVEGYTVFSQAFLLPRAQDEILGFTYGLVPAVLDTGPSGTYIYRLTVHKQAGWDALDVEITLRLPENAVVLNAHPQPVQGEDGLLVYDVVSKTDIEIALEYRLQED